MAEDLVFLHCGHMPTCDRRVDKQFDGYFTLQYMVAGGVELFYENDRHLLHGQWFWPAHPGPHIRFHAAPGLQTWHHRYVAFKGPLVSRWIAGGLLLEKPQAAPQRRNFTARFDELLLQARRADRWGTLRGINLLERLLLELAEAREQPQRREPWLERLLQRFDDGESLNLSYEHLADKEGMALSTLRRRFRTATGTALHTYVLHCRIGTARRLLGESDLPIKTIAEQLGYNDVYFFTRQFRKFSGVPPAVYRRSRQS